MKRNLKTKFLRAIIAEENEEIIEKFNKVDWIIYILIPVCILMKVFNANETIKWCVFFLITYLKSIPKEIRKSVKKLYKKYDIRLEHIKISKVILGNKNCVWQLIKGIEIFFMYCILEKYIFTELKDIEVLVIEIIIIIVVYNVNIYSRQIAKDISKIYKYDYNCLKKSEKET